MIRGIMCVDHGPSPRTGELKHLIRITAALALLYAGMTAALLIWTFSWPPPDPGTMAPADAIVCLGGGMAPDGTLAPPVLTRIDTCVRLYQAGLAPVVMFTGGTAGVDGIAAGGQMARYAATLGLPDDASLIEGSAQSTLQNALFSYPLLPATDHLIIVTEGFHLPRSYASFKWAAWEAGLPSPRIALAMSEQVRRDGGDRPNWRILARESLAIWFNLGRAVVYSAHPDPDVNWLH